MGKIVQDKDKRKTIIYARVSSNSQKDDLKNQVEFLKQYANAKGMIVDEIFEDVGSGLNYNRKKWNKLLEDCMLGAIKTIIVSHKDRFIRFGFDWFERFVKSNGVELIVVKDRKSTRLNSSHANISYAVFCLKKKNGSLSTH